MWARKGSCKGLMETPNPCACADTAEGRAKAGKHRRTGSWFARSSRGGEEVENYRSVSGLGLPYRTASGSCWPHTPRTVVSELGWASGWLACNPDGLLYACTQCDAVPCAVAKDSSAEVLTSSLRVSSAGVQGLGISAILMMARRHWAAFWDRTAVPAISVVPQAGARLGHLFGLAVCESCCPSKHLTQPKVPP